VNYKTEKEGWSGGEGRRGWGLESEIGDIV